MGGCFAKDEGIKCSLGNAEEVIRFGNLIHNSIRNVFRSTSVEIAVELMRCRE